MKNMTTILKILSTHVFCLLLALPLAAASRPEAALKKFDLSRMDKVQRIGAPVFSPDGQFIIIFVSRTNNETNRRDRRCLLINVHTKKQRTLEFKQPGVRSIRFSPGGKNLSFLSGGQVHIKPFPPVSNGEARRITNAPGGVRQYAWRPDGKYIAYLTEDAEPEKPAAEKFVTAFEVGNNSYLAASAPRPVHLWLIPVSGGDARRLTRGPQSVIAGPRWSPDGASILFTRGISPYPGDRSARTIKILRVSDGKIRGVTGNRMLEGDPSFSPDGSFISYLYPRDGNPAAVDDLYIIPTADNGKPRNLTSRLDRNIYSKSWLPDGKTLLVGGPKGTRSALWRVPLEGKPVQLDLWDIKAVYGETVSAGGAIAFIGIKSYHPSELYYLSSPEAEPVRLTGFNEQAAGWDLGKVETIEWQGEDGMKADGILTYPPGFSKEKKYPLVLLIHGGPNGFSEESFDSRAQVLAARGWVIFSPNYRGSNHRGNAFQTAIMNDAAEGPGRDIMAGVEAVKKRGFVDEKRFAVSGWSYGGYMTAWLIGRYPGVWKAAVAGAAPVDITDMTALSRMNVMFRHAITSSPWKGDNFKSYFDQSPIKYLSKIRTPTLILSKTGDTVVTVTGSYKLYHALKANGVPVQFIVYPGAGHAPGDPANRKDVLKRWIAWLSKYLSP
ncbi:MAG: S9 family peptidase [bacterium]|nr:S9 family peptidase [bacterium]